MTVKAKRFRIGVEGATTDGREKSSVNGWNRWQPATTRQCIPR